MLDEQVQLGVNQPLQSGDDYPFLVQGRPFSDAILDLSVQYLPGTHKLPLKLAAANNVATLDPVQIELLVEDADGVAVINATASNFVSQSNWAGYYRTLIWGDTDFKLVAVLGSERTSEVPASLTSPIKLDPRACVPILPGLTTMTVHPSRTSNVSYTLPRNVPVEIHPGFNMSIEAMPAAARTMGGNRIGGTLVFNAVAGAGEGEYVDCGSPERLLRSISGQAGQGGIFLIGGTDCFRIEPLVTPDADGFAIEPGILRIADDCEPCCDCEDYVPIYRSMERLLRRTRTAGRYLESLRDTYEFLRQRAVEAVQCRNQQMQVTAARSDDCEIAITGHFYNSGEETIDELLLIFEVFEEVEEDLWMPITPKAIPHVANRYSQESDQINIPLEFAHPNIFLAPLDCIGPLETKTLGFRIDLETDNNIKVCVHEYNNPQNTICYVTPTACTRANPDFNPYP